MFTCVQPPLYVTSPRRFGGWCGSAPRYAAERRSGFSVTSKVAMRGYDDATSLPVDRHRQTEVLQWSTGDATRRIVRSTGSDLIASRFQPTRPRSRNRTTSRIERRNRPTPIQHQNQTRTNPPRPRRTTSTRGFQNVGVYLGAGTQGTLNVLITRLRSRGTRRYQPPMRTSL